jgi:hypothetical protein
MLRAAPLGGGLALLAGGLAETGASKSLGIITANTWNYPMDVIWHMSNGSIILHKKCTKRTAMLAFTPTMTESF